MQPLHDDRLIFDVFAAHMQSRVTEISIRIGLFEALRQPSSIQVLCRSLSIGLRAAQTLVTVLAALGLVDISSNMVRLSGTAREYLLADSPFFKGNLFRLIPDEELQLLQAVHLRDDVRRPATQQWLAGKVARPNQQAEIMHAHTFAAGSAFARLPVFGSVQHLLDVGGGAGTISIALAQHNPHLNCTVMDLPAMRPAADALIHRFSMAERVNFCGADMFNSKWECGYDAVLLSNIFHDWEKDRCTALTQKAFDVLSPGGRIFVNEMLLNEGRDGPLSTALFSALMLFQMEGQQFTLPELQTLIEKANFVECELLASFGYYSLLTARRASGNKDGSL
jgi:ubiquinone/menaquinone biosynthesis C-methylase UbiE